MLRLTIRANLPPPNSLPKIPNPSALLNPSIPTILTNPKLQNLPQFKLQNPNNYGGLPPGGIGGNNNNGGWWNWEDGDRDEVSRQQPRLNPSGCAELPVDSMPGERIVSAGFAVMRLLTKVFYDFWNSIAVSTADAFAVVGCTFAVAAAALVCFLITLL